MSSAIANSQRPPDQPIHTGSEPSRESQKNPESMGPDKKEPVPWGLTEMVPFWAPLFTGRVPPKHDETVGGRVRGNSFICLHLCSLKLLQQKAFHEFFKLPAIKVL